MGSVMSKVARVATVITTGYAILLKSDEGSAGSSDDDRTVQHNYFDVDETGPGVGIVVEGQSNESSSISYDFSRQLLVDQQDSASVADTESSCPPIAAATKALPSGLIWGQGMLERGDSSSVISSSLMTRETQKDAGSRETSLEDGVNELFIACQRGESGIVKLVLQRGGIDVNKAAVGQGVTYKRRQGDDIYVTNIFPLWIASYAGHVQIVQQLLALSDIDVNKGASDESTPLFTACGQGHEQIVSQLLDRSEVDVNKMHTYGSTPLYRACDEGQGQVVALLVERSDVDVNEQSRSWHSPLMRACIRNDHHIVELLLTRSDTDVNTKSKTYGAVDDGLTPLLFASTFGYHHIVGHLLSRSDVDVNIERYGNGNEYGCDPLHIACEEGHHQIVEHLVARSDVDVNTPDRHDETPLYKACSRNHTLVVQQLLTRSDVNVNNAHLVNMLDDDDDDDDNDLPLTPTPLCIVCRSGNQEIVDLLLTRSDLDINETDDSNEQNETPLYIACQEGHPQIVQHLLAKSDVDVNKPDVYGSTPLHIACSCRHRGDFESESAYHAKVAQKKQIVGDLLARSDVDVNKQRVNLR